MRSKAENTKTKQKLKICGVEELGSCEVMEFGHPIWSPWSCKLLRKPTNHKSGRYKMMLMEKAKRYLMYPVVFPLYLTNQKTKVDII